MSPLRPLGLAVGAAAALVAAVAAADEPSWIFRPSTFTHDPMTGARVAQFMPTPPVEPLSDQRAVTSSYRRTRTSIRGPDGSSDTSYQVQQWGNDRGGIDAQWERFHNAWLESFLSGGYYNQGQYGPGGYGGYGGYGAGFPGARYGRPGYGYGYPGYGYGVPGYGYGGPGHGHGYPGYGRGGPTYGPGPDHGGPGFAPGDGAEE